MNDPSGLTRLLKAHLWLETCVDRALSIHLKKPDKINIAQMKFSTKVSLCSALDAFGEAELAALRAINRVRNRAAHDLHAELTVSEYKAVEDGIQGFARHLFVSAWYELDEQHPLDRQARRFSWAIIFLIHTLEYANVRARWHRENKASYDTYMLLRALLEKDGELSESEEARARAISKLPPGPEPTHVWANFPELERRGTEKRGESPAWVPGDGQPKFPDGRPVNPNEIVALVRELGWPEGKAPQK